MFVCPQQEQKRGSSWKRKKRYVKTLYPQIFPPHYSILYLLITILNKQTNNQQQKILIGKHTICRTKAMKDKKMGVDGKRVRQKGRTHKRLYSGRYFTIISALPMGRKNKRSKLQCMQTCMVQTNISFKSIPVEKIRIAKNNICTLGNTCKNIAQF